MKSRAGLQGKRRKYGISSSGCMCGAGDGAAVAGGGAGDAAAVAGGAAAGTGPGMDDVRFMEDMLPPVEIFPDLALFPLRPEPAAEGEDREAVGQEADAPAEHGKAEPDVLGAREQVDRG